MTTKVRDLFALIEHDEWRIVRVTGSHRPFQHAIKPGTVTISGKPSLYIPPGIRHGVLKQAELRK